MMQAVETERKYDITTIASQFAHKVVYQWKAVGIFYLFLLAIVLTIPLAIAAEQRIRNAMLADSKIMLETFPTFSIVNGIVKTPTDKPQIMLGKDNQVLLVVDTRPDASLKKHDTTRLITANKLFIKDHKGGATMNLHPNQGTFHIDRGILENVIEEAVLLGTLAFYPVSVIGMYLFLLSITFVLTLVSKLILKLYGMTLSFRSAFRVNTICIILPSLVVLTIMLMENYQGILDKMVFLALYLLCLFLMLYLCQGEVGASSSK